jgi:uncharacterized protein
VSPSTEGAKPEKKPGSSIRAWIRATHRDIGYVAVGLTLVYAVSGVAVNHIADWDPNFANHQRTHELGGPIAGDDRAAARAVMARLGIDAEVRDTSSSRSRSTNERCT